MTIAIVYPSGKISDTKFISAKRLFKNKEIKVFQPPLSDVAYLASNDQNRLNSIVNALKDRETTLLLAARGGYGALRLDFKQIKNTLEKFPKPIFGFSDITVLHALWSKTGFKSVHGAVFSQLPYLEPKDLNLNLNLLRKLEIIIEEKIQPTSNFNHQVLSGKLFGGNLATLETLVGTEIEPNFKNKIVFFEEIGEPAYKIDRMINHLFLSTNLKQAKALILGDFINCIDFNLKIFTDLINKYNPEIPLFYGFPSGHKNRNVPLLFGETATISSEIGVLRFNQKINLTEKTKLKISHQ